MAVIERLRQLKRFTRPSAWRFMALVATEPRWQPLYDSIARTSPGARFRNPVPWVAWNAIPVLAEEAGKREGQAVLEWGMGGSTLWYQQHGLRVTAIDHDPHWYAHCRTHLGAGADLRLVQDPVAYARPDIDPSGFGVFVIDGRHRVECARFLTENIRNGRIAPGSLIVFDNTERARYRDGVEALMGVCSAHRSYTGPISSEIDLMTTIFWV